MRKAPFGAFFYLVFGFVISVMCSRICVISSSISCLISGLNSRDAFILSAVILSSRYRAILALSNCAIAVSYQGCLRDDHFPSLTFCCRLLLSCLPLCRDGVPLPPRGRGKGRGGLASQYISLICTVLGDTGGSPWRTARARSPDG